MNLQQIVFNPREGGLKSFLMLRQYHFNLKRELNLFGNDKKVPTTGSAPTYVGKGMQITGKISGVRPIWIEGEVKGSIDCASEVIIGEAGKVDAAIRASTIKVNGFVEGQLIASSRIEVMAKGRVHGDIKCLAGCLIIHDGGIIELSLIHI